MALRPPRHDPRRATRWRLWLTLVGTVVVVHALLLALLPKGVGDGWRGDERRALQMRRIVLPTPAAETADPADPADVPVSPPARRVPAATPTAAPAPASEAPTDPPMTAALAVTAEAGGSPPPAYATRPAPAATLGYALSRGPLRGEATLEWLPAAERYEASLDARLGSLPLLRFTSQGAFDAHGLAPERFVDRRARRAAQAANFRRDEGRITFSGAAAEVPLAAGAQDRLSWMLQLAAIVDAAPARFPPGSRIALWVVGARGDADVWTFDVQAVEPLALPAGPLDGALRLQRAPARPYDLQAEVWLDPARHHLPVKVRLSPTGSGDATQFELADFVLR